MGVIVFCFREVSGDIEGLSGFLGRIRFLNVRCRVGILRVG